MTPSDREPTGQRIARARRRRGLSQAVLAGLVGRSESWLSPAMHTVADTVICPGQPTVGCCPICPRNYLVLLLRPYVSQSNVLTRSSVILHVDMGLVPAGLARARGGRLRGAAAWLPADASFGLGMRGSAQSSEVPAMHAGRQGHGRRFSRSSAVMDRSCRARPAALPDGPDVSR